MDLMLPRPKNGDIQTRQNKNEPVSLPLGTAEWLRFPAGSKPTFAHGDIFLGQTFDGHSVGVKPKGHIGVVAQSRSGKGTDIIIPNLVLYPGSVVVIDPKGENAVLTARRRANGSEYSRGMGQKVVLLDPFKIAASKDTLSDLRGSFNPMDMLGIDRDTSIDDAALIADSIMDFEDSASDKFWSESARDLLKGIMLHVTVSEEFEDSERNLLTVRDLILEGYADLHAMLLANSEDNRAPSAFSLMFRAMRKNHAFNGEISKAGSRFARMEANGPRMLESIASVACTNLDFLAGEQMKDCVRISSFGIADLKNDQRGMSLYLCLPQHVMGTHFRFLRMLISLVNAEISRLKEWPKSGHPILMVLDEFASLKRMQTIENAFAQIAGSGVCMMMIVQNIGQLKSTYKTNHTTLLENCATKVFFGIESETAEYVSKLCGDVETVRSTKNQSASHGSSSSQAKGVTIGQSSNATHGSTQSWSSSGQGSASASVSSSLSRGTSISVTDTKTIGDNRSQTMGMSETIHKRALVTPDEANRFFSDSDDPLALVKITGQQPLALRRIAYHQMKPLRGMYDPHPDHAPPPTLKKLPFILHLEELERAEAERRAQQELCLRIQERNKEIARKNAERDAKVHAHNAKVQQELAVLRRQNRKDFYINAAIVSGACIVASVLLYCEAYWTLIGLSALAFWHWARENGYAE